MEDDRQKGREPGRAGEGRRTTSRASVLGPIAAGVLLDLADFATLGPVGLYLGALVGGIAGWLLAAGLGVRRERRFGYAVAAAVYCTLPFTAYLPVATLLGAGVRLLEREPPGVDVPEPDTGRGPAIEAEYRSHWDDD